MGYLYLFCIASICRGILVQLAVQLAVDLLMSVNFSTVGATTPWTRATRPSNIGDHGDQVYLVTSNFCNWLSFYAEHCGKLTDLFAKFKKRKEEMEGNG